MQNLLLGDGCSCVGVRNMQPVKAGTPGNSRTCYVEFLKFNLQLSKRVGKGFIIHPQWSSHWEEKSVTTVFTSRWTESKRFRKMSHFNVSYLLQVFSHGILHAVMQQLTRFQLTQHVARSLCDSWTSCFKFNILWLHRVDWLVGCLVGV